MLFLFSLQNSVIGIQIEALRNTLAHLPLSFYIDIDRWGLLRDIVLLKLINTRSPFLEKVCFGWINRVRKSIF